MVIEPNNDNGAPNTTGKKLNTTNCRGVYKSCVNSNSTEVDGDNDGDVGLDGHDDNNTSILVADPPSSSFMLYEDFQLQFILLMGKRKRKRKPAHHLMFKFVGCLT